MSASWDTAIAALREGREDEAESQMRRLVSGGVADPRRLEILARVIYNRAIAAFASGGVGAAEPLLREALALAPDLPDLRRGLAEVVFRQAYDRAAAKDWPAAALAGWEAATLWPDLEAALGAPVAGLAQLLGGAGVSCAARDPLSACRLLLAAWGLNPLADTHYATARSLFIHLGTGELGTAIDAGAFEGLLARDPRDLVALIGLSNLQRRARNLNLAETLLRRGLAFSPENPFALGRLAALTAEQGRIVEADRLFQALGQRYGGVEAAIHLAPDFIDSLRPAAAPPDPAGPDRAAGIGAVVMAGCDPVYFHRFADALANSVARYCRSVVLHFHVIDPDDAVSARLQEMCRRLPGLPIRLTTEPLPAGLPPELRRTYFACARFLCLPQILAAYRRPVLMLDVDIVVLRDVGPLVEQLMTETADLALIHAEPRNPWCRVWAGMVLAAPTRRGLDYFTLVRNYLLAVLRAGKAIWFLDQIALFAVLVAGFRNRDRPLVIEWPVDIQNSSTDHAYFWSLNVSQPSNAASPESALYLKFKNNQI